MTIHEALVQLAYGKKIRNENFAAGTYCKYSSLGYIDDPEFGFLTQDEFLKEYKDFSENWYIYE